MLLFQQNEPIPTRRDVFIQMVDAVDQVTPKASLTLTVAIVKAGATTYVPIAGACSEISDGTYRISLAPGDLDTLGQAMLKASATGAAPQFIPIQVVRFLDEVHLAKAALVNARTHAIDTGVNEIKDDDNITTLRTLTPGESNGIVTITPV